MRIFLGCVCQSIEVMMKADEGGSIIIFDRWVDVIFGCSFSGCEIVGFRDTEAGW